jgi:hypothetical protein
MLPDTSFFVELERRVWQALADGDVEADMNLLDPRFVGVYASGFASREDHAGQLADGPSVKDFSIHDPRLLPLAADTAILSYRATFTRPGKSDAASVQTMYVSSIWCQRGASWVNVFSQDTPASEASP